jgi:ATP-dependent exoDNAse (exonuclease V) alpha subunit
MYKGTKIIITENLYPKLEIVNGNIGYIKNISLINSEWI